MTKAGRKIEAYLAKHPGASSPAEIAKATDTSRDTVRVYLKKRAAAPAAAPAAAAAAPAPAADGEDLHEDYPAGRKKPAAAPKPDDVDQVDEDLDAKPKRTRFRLVL